MANQRLYRIQFEDPEWTEEVFATRLGEDRYRLDEEPLFSEVAQFRDVIEAEAQPGGILEFKRVVKRSAYETSGFLISTVAVNSDAFTDLQERVEGLGGEWSLAFNGYLLLHLPPEADFDPADEVRQMTIAAHRDAEPS